MRATVLLPTTGSRPALLRVAAQSVLRQSVEDLELFVMGDGVSEASREAIQALVAEDARVRFFDHEKHARRGEPYRHAALKEARGRVVCYLTDRDLMLPDHVAEAERILEDADFGHTLRHHVLASGRLAFRHTLDIDDPTDRAAAQTATYLIPLSFAVHTRDAYLRLPHGWRTTPEGTPTDAHMWRQFLAEPTIRTATSTRPTILYFKRGAHPGWSEALRLEEMSRYAERIRDPEWLRAHEATVRDAAIRDRAALVRPAPETPTQQRRSWPERGLRRVARSLRRRLRRASGIPAPRPPRSAAPHVGFVASHPLGDGLVLEAYWVGEPVGPGPGASLRLGDFELIRLDCFGGAKGHMHYDMERVRTIGAANARIYFPAGTIREHIECGVTEIVRNTPYAIRTHHDAAVRALRPAPDTLEAAGRFLREHWLDVAAGHGVDVDAAPGGEPEPPA